MVTDARFRGTTVGVAINVLAYCFAVLAGMLVQYLFGQPQPTKADPQPAAVVSAQTQISHVMVANPGLRPVRSERASVGEALVSVRYQ